MIYLIWSPYETKDMYITQSYNMEPFEAIRNGFPRH